MIDNKKMWEAIIDSLRTVGSQTSDELYADLIIALKNQGLIFDIKEKRIISIASEEIKGNKEKDSPKSGLYMCTTEEANTLNAATPKFYVGAIYKYDKDKGINIGDGWLGISDETLLKYFCPIEEKQSPKFIEAGKWYVCIRTSYRPNGEDFIEGRIYYAKDDYKMLGECGEVDIATDNPGEFFRPATKGEIDLIVKGHAKYLMGGIKQKEKANTSKSTDLEQAIINMLVKRTNEETISKKQAAEWSPIFLSIARKQIASEVDVDAIVERHSPSNGVTVQKYTVRAFVRNIVKDVLKEIQKQ